MKSYQFPVIITRDEEGMYFAKVPHLPGCHTQAASLDVLQKRVAEAIELALEVQKQKHNKIFQDTFVGVQQFQVSI